MNKEIFVSCIMSNYNTNPYLLKDSIESILNQTHSNFEFIIVDDASTDKNSVEIIKYYAEKDKRIKFLLNKKNSKLAFSLNKALDVAKGKYVFRMDTDDISYKNRFEEQIRFMEINKDLLVSGTYVKNIGDSSGYRIMPFTSFEKINYQLLYSTVLLHPTVVFRLEMLNKFGLRYNEEIKYSQDYELWTRIKNFGKISILPKVLLQYRVHSKQVSVERKQEQSKYALDIYIDQLRKVYYEEISELEHKIFCGIDELNYENIDKLIKWIRLLVKKSIIGKNDDFKIVVFYRFVSLILNSSMSKYNKIKNILKYKKDINITVYFFVLKKMLKMIFLKINRR